VLAEIRSMMRRAFYMTELPISYFDEWDSIANCPRRFYNFSFWKPSVNGYVYTVG
jgi:hypothetical protein